ncbi:MAG: polysaccharide biosynthesis protein [Candidatus Firestonebacteria bacterium]
MKTIFHGKKILITGGAGSVGRALTERILKYKPSIIRIFDVSENEMFKMRNDFARPKVMRYLIGDIRDMDRLKLAMEGIDIVVHLAAMKHVYACEYNPFEAIKTNIDGLQNVISASRDANVQKVVFSSTDKAANPSSVMGTTKLLGEKLISLANYYKGNKKTIFSSVRFGNVIGSNGSVITLFKKQILEKKPLTITDKAMTRFVITMNEAVDLICSAIILAKGGETFVWKMRTLRVTDLANAMAGIYGRKGQIKKIIIGKGHGEKIHEEIMSEDELSRAIMLKNLYVVFPLIDYLHVIRRYKNTDKVRNPVISSVMGRHMQEAEIAGLFKTLNI